MLLSKVHLNFTLVLAIFGLFILGASAPPPAPAHIAAASVNKAAASFAAKYATQLAIGAGYGCGLSSDGAVQCWGSNAFGQLGNGSMAGPNQLAPVAVVGLPASAAEVTAGVYHSCARTGPTIHCWGRNDDGQLGNGNFADQHTPVQVIGLPSRANSVVAGAFHSCAILSTGAVYCWGANYTGQLGNNSYTTSATPVQVSGLNGSAVAIAVGLYHTCAILTDETIKCWGSNGWGELGDATFDDSLVPVAVVGLGGKPVAIVAGGSHNCVLLSNGSLQCWGWNVKGQLGDGTDVNRNQPTNVSGIAIVAQHIAASWWHTCAHLADNTVYCWGDNEFSQIGDGTFTERLSPVLVRGLAGQIDNLAAGPYSSCVVLATGVVKCWGSNFGGELGDGTHVGYRLLPVTMNGYGVDVVTIVSGANHNCSLLTTGAVKCWGSNFDGQLGDGTTTNRWTPVAVVGLSGPVVAVAPGDSHTCVLLVNGLVQCWGRNVDGQLGTGNNTNSLTPVSVQLLGGPVLALTSGGAHTCAALVTNIVQCWGWNNFGQLGNNTTASSNTPVVVQNISDANPIRMLSAGSSHTCLKQGPDVKCWGANFTGQLGNGNTTNQLTAVTVSNISGAGVIELALGAFHSCALLTTTGLKCWGNNGLGQLGLGNEIDSYTPADVVSLTSDATRLAAGYFHTCATKRDLTMWCWGWNFEGQLGDTTTLDRNTPVDVQFLNGSAVIPSTGVAHSCVLYAAGNVQCWGYNFSGQLGNGTTQNSLLPVDVFALIHKVFLPMLTR